MINFIKKIVLNNKIEKEIINKWNIFIDSINKKGQNGINQKLEINEIIIKEYGFDLIISLPYGYEYIKFRELLPLLELVYKGDIIAELSNKNTYTIYLRCRFKNLKVSEIDNIKFKWYKHFYNLRNSYGESFKINKIENIYNPNLEDDIVGYRLYVDIPEGLKYSQLLSEEDNLSKIIGKTFMEWNDELNQVLIEVNTKLLTNEEPYRLVKVNPWELYCTTTYSYKNIIMDMKVSSNCLWSGVNGSGKTVNMEQSLINLALQYDENKVQFFISFINFKSDLRILSNLRNTKFYGTTLEETYGILKYLLKECEKRNKLFESIEGQYIVNIQKYNEYCPNKQLPYLYFISDEIIDFVSDKTDTEEDKNLKDNIVDSLKKLGRIGRSSGIYLCLSLQEARKESIAPSLKSQLNCMVCFNQVNSATGMTLLSSEANGMRLTRLNKANRECIVKYQDGMVLAKSLNFSEQKMLELIKNISKNNKNYIKIDKNGNKINKNISKTNKNEQKIEKNTKKNNNRWVIYKNKNKEVISNND